jgi:hypothetical protein
MMPITSPLNKFGNPEVPYVLLRNDVEISDKTERKVRTIEIGGTVIVKGNGLFNVWDVLGYEIHSGTIDIKGNVPGLLHTTRTEGMGFVCHEKGMTLDIQKIIEAGSPDQDEFSDIEVPWSSKEAWIYSMTAEKVPVILLTSNGLEWGREIRRKGLVLTDGPGQPVYRILPDTETEIKNKNGISAMGYVIDVEKKITIPIIVDIKIEKGPADPKNKTEKPLVNPPEQIKVYLKGKFEGVLGKIIAFDKIQDTLGVGTSKKDFWMGIGIGLVVMFIVRLLI